MKIRLLPRHLCARSLTMAVLGLLCALQLLCLLRAPAVYSPATVTVTLGAGQAASLGRAELAAPHAAPSHLALHRDSAGAWWIRNASAGKQVLLQRDGDERRMGSRALRAGQWFQAGATRFDVTAASTRTVAFTAGGRQWEFDGATLRRDGSAQPACPGTPIAARVLALWNRAAPHALTAARPLVLGGNLHCGNRLGIAHLAGGSAQFVRARDGLLLSNAAGSEAVAPVLVSSGAGALELAGSEERLRGVTALTAGRTRFAVRTDGSRLHLRPLRNVALFTEAQARLPAAVSWDWQQRAAWRVPAGSPWYTMLFLAACTVAAGALAWQRGAWPFVRGSSAVNRAAAGGALLLAVAGLGALLFLRSGASLGAGISMLLGWAALWTCLMTIARPALATCAGLVLLAAGLLVQMELGLGAQESSWLRHFQKTSALLAIGLGAGTFVRLRLQGARLPLPQTGVEWVLALVAGAALAGLILQVLFGNETGVFDLQPVEFAKLALTALTAHCIAVGLGWQRGMPLRWARMAAPVLLFAALLGLALVQVDDYSPLILLLVWSVAMALAWSVAERKPAVVAALAGLACLAVGTVAWMRVSGAAEGAQWGFYADRFAVWLDPARHPHTGQQLLLAARAVAEGAWWGADNWLGIGALGQAAGSALLIPAVQDDFAPSFLINRHGLLGALALWLVQALFVGGLLHTAARCFAAAGRTRDFRQGWLWRFRCFVLCGGAAFVLGHLLLSWGTNLAIFPIMGQPMSFLSAGGSHLLFFICPLLAFHALSAHSLEESQSCRSMSNTKSWAR